MSDIAVLGFDIQSKALADANKDLDKTTEAAGKADKAVDKLTNTTKELDNANKRMSSSTIRVANDVELTTRALKDAERAYKSAADRAQEMARMGRSALAGAAGGGSNDDGPPQKARRRTQYDIPGSTVAFAPADAVHKVNEELEKTPALADAALGAVKKAALGTASQTDLAANKAKDTADRASESYSKLVGHAERFILAKEAERAGLGLSVQAAARLRYEQDLLNRASKAGIDLSPEQVAHLKSLAAGMARAEVAAAGFGKVLKTVVGVVSGVGGAILGAFSLKAFIGNTELVSDALKDLGKTWSSILEVATVAALPLVNAIENLGKALDNPTFRAFVQTIGVLLFGAFQLAIEGVTALVNGFIVLLDNLDTIKVAAATTGAILLVAFGPAILSAIAFGFGAMASAGVAAISAITAAIAANPLGALAVGVVAAVTALYYFRDEVKKAIGVDVIGIVKMAANYVIGSFVAAYEDIKFVWKSFPDIIGAAVIGAVNAIVSGVNKVIQVAAEKIDWLIDKANKINPFSPIPKIGEIGDVQPLRNAYADRLGNAVGDRNKAVQDALSTDYLGKFGDMFKLSEPSVRKFNETLTETSKAAKSAKEEVDKSAEAYAKIVLYAEQFIAKQEAERAGIGLSAEAAARLRYEQELLNRAQKAGIDLSPAQLAQLQSLAAGMARAEAETTALKEAYDFAKGTFKGFISDFNRGIEQGKGILESFGEAGVNALKKISDKLLDMAMNKLFENAFGGSSGGGGGFLNNIFSNLFGSGSSVDTSAFVGTGMTYAKGGVFSRGNVIPFANGGVVSRPTLFPMANGAGLMGEAGPEAVMPLRRGRGGRLGVSAGNDNGGGIVINMPVTFGSDVSRAEMGRWVGIVKQQAMDGAIAGVEAKRRRGGSMKASFAGR